MPEQTFQFPTIRRRLADGSELVEAIGLPEISALGGSLDEAQTILAAKARQFLANDELCPALGLYRRRSAVAPVLEEVTLEIPPPGRPAEWEAPVALSFQVARWSERADLHFAQVPSLGILVVGPVAEQMPARIREHIRLALVSRAKRLTLPALEETQRVESVECGDLRVSVHIRTPRELEVAAEAPAEEGSILPRLAEELAPARGSRRSGVGGANGTAPASVPAPANAAYEVEDLVKQLAAALSGTPARSVLLVGPPGCGKSAIVGELARRRSEFGFGHTAFWTTSAARLMTGQAGFGMWQDRCLKFCRELSTQRGLVHLGALAELQEVGRHARGAENMAGLLRPWIARGEILAIAEATPAQLAVLEREEPQLVAAFLPIQVPEPEPAVLRRILSRVWDDAAGRPGVRPDTALTWLHRLHARYATYSATPGRPVRFLRELLADRFPAREFGVEEVTAAFSRETGLPRVLLDDALPLDLGATRDWFAARVIGQPAAVNRVLDVLALIKSRLARPRRPLASLLFIGPTGTGKTELARSLATFLFGDADRLARFDLSEFSDPLSVQRLIGGVGAGSPEGLLTARVREQPFSVLLFDEFEKADASFFDLLLQVLGEGRLTDAAGRVADFCNSVIVMTSNLGAESLRRGPSGFGPGQDAGGADHFAGAVRQFLRPEIYNRLDSIVPFDALSREAIEAIAQRLVGMVQRRDGIRQRTVELRFEPGVIGHLADRGYDVRYGARPLKRRIEHDLVAPLAAALNEYDESTALTATISVAPGGLSIRVAGRSSGLGVPTLGGPDLEAARSFTRLRRAIARLRQSSAVTSLENQVSLLEALENSLARARWKQPEAQAKLARLPVLKSCFANLAALEREVEESETEALVSCFGGGESGGRNRSAFAASSQQQRFRDLQRQVFGLGFERPDDAVIAFFAEPREFILPLAQAYHRLLSLRGAVLKLDVFMTPPAGRAAGTKPIRKTPEKPESVFLDPPKNLLGIVMQVRGTLLWPWLLGESGLHVLKERQGEQHGLVQVEPGGFAEFQPPAGIDRPRGIKSMHAPTCRTYDREDSVVTDAVLKQRPWTGSSIDSCLASLLDERLELAVNAVGGPA